VIKLILAQMTLLLGGMDWRGLEQNPTKSPRWRGKVPVFLGFGAIVC
jgi:transposase